MTNRIRNVIVRRLHLCSLALAWSMVIAAGSAGAENSELEELVISEGFERVDLPSGLWRGGAIALLADGSVLLAYSNSRNLNGELGHADIFGITSADKSSTWSEPRLLVNSASYNAARPSFLRTRHGRLFLFYFGFVNYDKASAAKSSCNLYMVQSDEDGATWSEPVCVFEGYTGGWRSGIETQSGRLVVTTCFAVDQFRKVCASLTSRDQGKTWRRSNVIDLGGRGSHAGAMEPAVVELKDGRLWMLIRTQGNFWQAFSEDDGQTWCAASKTSITNPERLGGAPASVIRLDSGRLTMAWNPRMETPPAASAWRKIGRGALAVALSDDDGKTWTKPRVCARGAMVTYPYLLEISPGELLLTTGLLKARNERTDTVMLHFTEQSLLDAR